MVLQSGLKFKTNHQLYDQFLSQARLFKKKKQTFYNLLNSITDENKEIKLCKIEIIQFLP